jgi:effector-binding domain-containing protein
VAAPARRSVVSSQAEKKEIAPGRNVMLYKDDVPNVEVGVEVGGSFAPLGRIVASTLPAGPVVMTTHRGSWDVGPAHRAVADECERLGLERVGPSWEIYGHFNAPGDEEVEIYYLVR